MSLDTEDLFAKAIEARKNKPERQSFDNQYDPVNYTALGEHYKQIRLLGNPIEFRNQDPFSPKVINVAWLVGDDDKRFRVIYPDKDENPGWILWKILAKVLRYNWNKAKKEKEYMFPDSDIFKRVHTNNSINPYDKGWEPSKLVAQNCIDRSAMDWHRENKKTLLLSRRVSETTREDGTVNQFFDLGYPSSIYNNVMNEIVSYAGGWSNYDLLLKKVDADPWYIIRHAVDDYKKFAGELSTFAYFEQYAGAPLTQEEQSWERFNIDKIFPVTSYTKIMNRLKGAIIQVDATFKTSFFSELERLVEVEEKNRPKKEDSDVSSDSNESSFTPAASVASSNPTPAAVSANPPVFAPEVAAPVAETPAPAARRVVSEKAAVDWANLAALGYAGVMKMDEAAKASVLAVNPDGSFTWNGGDLAECPKCKFMSPMSVPVCAKCGAIFE